MGILYNVGVTQILMTNNEYRAVVFSEMIKEESAVVKFESVFPILYLIKEKYITLKNVLMEIA